MAAYLIAQINITDPERYQDYIPQVPATVEKYGGEFLVRGGDFEVLEGDWPEVRTVILKFPSVEQARAWHGSEEYAGPKAIRHEASTTNLILVAGT